MQAAGASLDAEAIVNDIARLKGRPEYKNYITFANPAEMLGGDQNTILSPAVTSRETVRRNIPTGGTQASRSAITQQALSGGSQISGQQAAQMSRSPA